MGGSNSKSMPSPIILSSTARQTAALIFFHGLGDTGHSWASILSPFCAPHIKYIFPTAATMPVTLNAGFSMPSWFDLKTLNVHGPEDEEGIKAAAAKVHKMIEDEEKNGIPSNRIMLGGFSQGGALALYSALKYAKPLAGLVALSCWLPLYKSFPQAAVGNTNMPVFQCHGNSDPVVPFQYGELTSQCLKSFMPHTQFKAYPTLMHTFCEEELEDTVTFISHHLPSTDAREESKPS